MLAAFLRRLGISRGFASAAGAMSGVEERLFEALFPGQGRYTPDKAAQLASRLRDVAASLEPPPAAAAAAAAAAPRRPEEGSEEPASKRRRKEQRGRGKDLDFSAYQQRYVALELLYLGHAYGGFARQENTEETIEGHLFSALRQTRLIPAGASWQELRYSRGGRTDKGVSALGQVVALLLRSAGRAGQPGPVPAGSELDYPALLNRVLPRDIRVLGWTDVPEDFSARFSAEFREYKYLIAFQPPAPPSSAGGRTGATAAAAAAAAPAADSSTAAAAAGGGSGDAVQQGAAPAADQQQWQRGQQAGSLAPVLDVGRMREAAAHFLGEHDFRNFCKVDVAQAQNFTRRVLDFRIEELPGCGWGGRALLQLHIRGTAFLWHQVRCMAAVLLMVGRSEEEPGIVARLLDTTATPRKPQYNMASEEPLLLYSCAYGGLAFRRTAANYALVRGQLEEMLTSHMIRAGTLHTIQQRLAADRLLDEGGSDGSGNGGSGGKRKAGPAAAGPKHVPLLLRAKEPAVEERLLKLAASRGAAVAGAAAAGEPKAQRQQRQHEHQPSGGAAAVECVQE
ncbi:hypothetical protein ABPG75_004035 [Micractinium tetrahymenae]